MFRPASLLRSSCNPSTSSAAATAAAAAATAAGSANTSSRALLADVVAHDPVFVPSTARAADSDRNDVGRSLSFSIADDRRGRRAAPLPRISVDCGGCRPHHGNAAPPPLVVTKAKRSNSSACKNTKVERRVRENGRFYETGGVAEGRTCPPVSPSSPSKTFSTSRSRCSYYDHRNCFNEAKLEDLKKTKNSKKNSKKKKKKKLLLTNSYGFTSSSSIESDDGCGFFSSEEEETEAFFSSKSFSSDSSEFYRRPLPKPRSINATTKEKKSRRRLRSRTVGGSCNSCNVKEGFQPLVSVAAASKDQAANYKKKAGFAVVKRSSDPYADFRTSMAEMIVERQIFGADDLERLLQSYLALNAPRHHPVILQAFSDIWVTLFGN